MRLLLIGAILPLSCTSLIDQEINPKTFYKRDVVIDCDGKEYSGFAVLPLQDKYNCTFHFYGKVDLFTFQTCHRHIAIEDAGKPGWIKKQKRVDFTYEPAKSIEYDEYCPVEIGGYEQARGRHAWGFIDIKTRFETLDADLVCNGERVSSQGVSVCQSMIGLLQEVRFDEPVSFVIDRCKFPSPIEPGLYRFPMQKGRCVYAFKGLQSGKFHRLTTLGYEQVLIREFN